MKAISLLQPWAHLVCIGAKKNETRGWRTEHRGRILIHASKPREQAAVLAFWPHFAAFVQQYHKLTYGAVIGECKIVACIETERLVKNLSERERAFGDYTPGRWAWVLSDPILYDLPIPYKGSLSVWNFPDEILAMHSLQKKLD